MVLCGSCLRIMVVCTGCGLCHHHCGHGSMVVLCWSIIIWLWSPLFVMCHHHSSLLLCIMVTVGGALSSMEVALALWWYVAVHGHGHAHPLSASCSSTMVTWSSLIPCGPLSSMKDDDICHHHLSEQGVGRRGPYTYLGSASAM